MSKKLADVIEENGIVHIILIVNQSLMNGKR